eukprot:CAMPEP_0169433552 /NCGR_PEP_ID=MMETSP1042-20121227/4065_1 /TAXON_ID=464988 /ORGANISM="Hemiselmis andersenii, Strain CCMP1180" /LENGTH=46 /DNA_ID= /DNA_START= /DNA_END= /DNA_ORIENTATION=
MTIRPGLPSQTAASNTPRMPRTGAAAPLRARFGTQQAPHSTPSCST